jgi:hypothetical protein
MLLSSAAALLFWAGAFDANASVVAETRGGVAPIQAGRQSQAAIGISVAPVVEIETGRPGQGLHIDYGPRILWREPNNLSLKRPLILHVANLAAATQPNTAVEFLARAGASLGEADYAALSQIFGTAQGTVPQVMKIFAASGGLGFRWDENRTWRFETTLEAEHRRTLASVIDPQTIPDPMMMTALQQSFRQTNFTLMPSAIAHLSRRDDLILTAAVSDRMLDNGISLFAVAPQVGWKTRLAPNAELRLAGGVSYVRDLGTVPIVGSGGSLAPIGNAEVSALVLRHRGVAMRSGAGVTFDYFVDPFLRAAGPRGTAVAQSLLLFPPNWTVGVEASFSTSLRGSAITGNPDETTAAVSLPVRHRMSENLIGEAGLRWSVRAPRWRADDFAFHFDQQQFWVYVAMTATTHRLDPWSAPTQQTATAGQQAIGGGLRPVSGSTRGAEGGSSTDTGLTTSAEAVRNAGNSNRAGGSPDGVQASPMEGSSSGQGDQSNDSDLGNPNVAPTGAGVP